MFLQFTHKKGLFFYLVCAFQSHFSVLFSSEALACWQQLAQTYQFHVGPLESALQ